MPQKAVARASGLIECLFSALSVAERISCLRQASEAWIRLNSDASRAATSLDRWKSQTPFAAGASPEKRLHLDGLIEEVLLAILALPPEAYSELIASPPDWVRELDRLYLTPRSFDGDPE